MNSPTSVASASNGFSKVKRASEVAVEAYQKHEFTDAVCRSTFVGQKEALSHSEATDHQQFDLRLMTINREETQLKGSGSNTLGAKTLRLLWTHLNVKFSLVLRVVNFSWENVAM
ncbi:hypothetical protein DVH05_017141 [Phytophthora capsici]|nr:hypothetical protein DVH05_017141 [Phytophthora capsici]|eukprot:jgi/Phyca11/21133/fgenesh1_pg.PHYCAscaffold_83_\